MMSACSCGSKGVANDPPLLSAAGAPLRVEEPGTSRLAAASRQSLCSRAPAAFYASLSEEDS